KILVTGGAGFIGSNIVDAYIAAGHDVVVLDNLSTGRIKNLNKKAEFAQLDIQDDLSALFSKHKFDIVNHHAAQMDVRRSVEDPIFDARTNVLGFINILQNCAKSGVKKVIFASSGGAIYGEQDYFPADENHKTQPYSPYGITKLVGEKYLFFYNLTYNLNYVVLRYANVYGPRQNPHGEAGVVAIFIKKLLDGEQPFINGNGEQTRDFVFVRDVVKANVLALDYEQSDIFNVGTGVETNVNQLYQAINKLTGKNMPEKHAPAKEGEQMRSVVDHSKIQTVLGWTQDYNLEQGLKETVEYFISNE
ncbi:MAG: NAD-dependent epimerase/dehydratase family protein, partial [Calditrichaeota bacterium]|nr:NAD-dependent epimerase/dehydratase family protein [Calditrichota bacterium]